MKTIKIILLVSAFVIIRSEAKGQNTEPDTVVQAIDMEVYFQQKQVEVNEKLDFPSLSYPGFKHIRWGINTNSIKQTQVSTQAFGDEVTTQLIRSGDVVTGVQFMKSNSADRRESFIQFTRIKNQLYDRYGSPSHHVSPVQQIDGSDAFLSGQVDMYQLEWRGKESMITLILAEKQVTVEFSKSPYSEL